MSGAESLIDGQSGKHHVHAMKLTKSGNAAYFRLRVILCYREASLRNVPIAGNLSSLPKR